jgi:hypothetical protein
VSAVAAAAPAGRGGGHGGILRRRRYGAGVAAEVSAQPSGQCRPCADRQR